MSVQLAARDGEPYCAVSDIGGTFARHDKESRTILHRTHSTLRRSSIKGSQRRLARARYHLIGHRPSSSPNLSRPEAPRSIKPISPHPPHRAPSGQRDIEPSSDKSSSRGRHGPPACPPTSTLMCRPTPSARPKQAHLLLSAASQRAQRGLRRV